MDTAGLELEVIKVFEHINEKQNFVLSGGAGSGKTYSLISIINTIFKYKPTASIACITYTNAAVDEIKSRIQNKNLIVKTIHDFLWEMIKSFKYELKETLKEGIEQNAYKDINEKKALQFEKNFENINTIEYKEHLKLEEGFISHDEIIILANEMFKKYKKLRQILNSSFDYIFVDEYQDTSPKVVEIFLDYFKDLKHKSIIGFFGDSMQAIYDEGIGDLEKYIQQNLVYKVEKEQNRRNPQCVIDLANKIRTDGLNQKPSNDNNAPNMKNGQIKNGSIKFLYSLKDIDLDKLKQTEHFKNWDFNNKDETKQLMLTNKLIAKQNNFEKIYNIYDGILINDLKKLIKKFDDDNEIVEKIIGKNNLKDKLENFIEKDKNLCSRLYDLVKDKSISEIKNVYLDKDALISIPNENSSTESKRDKLIKHLIKIQYLIKSYENKQYNEVIRISEFNLQNLQDKKILRENIEFINNNTNSKTIDEIIQFANDKNLCKIDDKLKSFIEKNWYLCEALKDIPYSEIINLYEYVEGFTPFSTQHKIKGEQFDNVFIVLDNGKWNNYNFTSLFDENATKSETVLNRTKKLFYVCCTRAKENLVIYMNIKNSKNSKNILEAAKELFGEENCYEIST